MKALVAHGFRFEVLRYGPATGFVPEPIDLRILPGPRDTIRIIRVQPRTSHVLGLTPRETTRALHWADQGGWVQALAAVHRDESCGFTLLLRKGRHIEWHVRPVRYLTLAPSGPLTEQPPPGRHVRRHACMPTGRR